ncbi:EAL domain-containing protein [Alteromonas sediminis]|uniref:EAL domain-containing protein n=1 Tax=Alteromonas sediminis TaxID=2259342 RepID=A0A3N5Y3M5_9ALTE|nr:cache domain-containing protein [Alteromonas sediminis]RPJ68667.1 EAL domain-containing protein [Alteromonas sediminis]
MKVANNKKLLRLIRFIPPILVIAFALSAILIVINNNKIKLDSDLKALRTDFIESRKSMMKAQVEQLIQQINFELKSTEAVLKDNIKAQIYQAHTIASRLYEANKDKSEQYVTNLITSALRDLRFNNGRGYFFIYKTDGESVMHPILPDMEGQNKIALQDVRGNYIVRDMGLLAKENGEAYYTWWFVKPGNTQQEFQKIGFGKHFAPYDWFIGTGEYVIDVENDIKQRVLNEIANIRYGEDGYAFVFNNAGIGLVHVNDEYVGKSILQHPEPDVSKTVLDLIQLAQSGGGFIRYDNFIRPSTSIREPKISFVQGVPNWQWAVGMGFYEDEIAEQLAQREAEIENQNQQQLNELLWLSSISTLFFVVMSLLLTKNLSRRFTDYEGKINHDFQELNRIKLESQYQALHDALTALPNRTLLEEHVHQGVAISKDKGKMLALAFVDLDDFKKINDLHGHSVGDEFLKLLSDVFKRTIDKGDSVARFGGDEFIFCFPELDNLAQAENKVKKILRVFEREFHLKGKSIYSSGSVGVSVYPQDGEDTEALISKADIALYKSKAAKKGQALFFNTALDEQVKRDFLIETELRGAMNKGEIAVHYQPQISVKSGDIIGVEALVRWNSAKLGAVSPADFIPIAENTGIIRELGSYIIYKAMSDIKALNDNLPVPLNVSINISPKQLMESDFVDSVMQASRELGLDSQWVTLEITENVLISDLSVVQPTLEALKNNGFKISLDDFGTGFSSLSYLSNLPLNEIKIDRSFIDKFLSSSHSESLVKTIIAIGEFCHLSVVAEGVETQAQFDLLSEYHCDAVQGYLFYKPLPLSELVEKCRSHQNHTHSVGE